MKPNRLTLLIVFSQSYPCFVHSLEHQAIVAEGDAVLDAAFDEIQLFVQENAWFNEIEDFCNSWNVHTKLKWKDAQAYHIEVITPRHQYSLLCF